MLGKGNCFKRKNWAVLWWSFVAIVHRGRRKWRTWNCSSWTNYRK